MTIEVELPEVKWEIEYGDLKLHIKHPGFKTEVVVNRFTAEKLMEFIKENMT